MHMLERPGDEEIFLANARRLRGLAALLAGPSAAEDVVAAALLRAMSSPGWPAVENHGAYLTRAVINEVRSSHRSSLRREARECAVSGPEVAVDGYSTPEVLAAMASLPIPAGIVPLRRTWSRTPACP